MTATFNVLCRAGAWPWEDEPPLCVEDPWPPPDGVGLAPAHPLTIIDSVNAMMTFSDREARAQAEAAGRENLAKVADDTVRERLTPSAPRADEENGSTRD